MIAVAIDGPAGAGKSTIARQAAKKIGFIYVDTGALYRTVGLFMLRNGIVPSDEKMVAEEVDSGRVKIGLTFQNGEQKVLLGGEDVTGQIRTPEVSVASSQVSAIPKVREFLFSLQKDLAKENHVIMDGRDIGTVVLPEAQVKIFLTASAEERAKRRCKELREKGIEADFGNVLRDIEERDYNDSHRAIAPLVPAKDAVLVDTSAMTLEQAVDTVLDLVETALSSN
ncbi:MAG: (d)CMP kinase [Clostridiales bacterium]|jgi:cytidylate kinase|nr:(d)CMP kinase [Clostridiales bacterium]